LLNVVQKKSLRQRDPIVWEAVMQPPALVIDCTITDRKLIRHAGRKERTIKRRTSTRERSSALKPNAVREDQDGDATA
jgi:hypothetical protein